jgi:hypothetical protein
MATYESRRYATIPIAATQVANGSVTDAEFQYINTLASNAQTQITARAALAGATFTGGVRINDSQNLNIGSATDLVISHDTNNSKINNTTGELRIGADTIKLMNQAEDETHLSATADGAVSLYHNNVVKAATSAAGVTISGTLAATAVTGDASGMSNLPTGPTGPTGPAGPTGSAGSTGPTGPTGPAGTSFSMTFDSVGSLVLACTSSSQSANTTIAGSSLYYAYTQNAGQISSGTSFTTWASALGSSTLSGTWRCLGKSHTQTISWGGQSSGSATVYFPGLFIRIS